MKVLLLTGGSGTRLWPLSRRRFPKQFLRFGELSLLRETAQRLLQSVKPEDIIVLTNKDYRFQVMNELEGLGISHAVLEPVAKNTAPAIALGAAYCRYILGCSDEEVLFVSPSDHKISPPDALAKVMPAIEFMARRGHIVTLGIPPTRPETGYGYIELGDALEEGFYKVERFTEKPDEATAREYLSSGRFLWNSGMFAFTIGTITQELSRHLPSVGELMLKGYEEMLEAFSELPSISIDYAVMERSSRIVTLPFEVYWSDVGSWDSLFEVLVKDQNGNVTQGDVLTLSTKNSLVLSKDRLLVTVGLKDSIVVETEDAVFVAPRGESQQVREVVDALTAQGRQEAEENPTVFRPWGSYTVLKESEGYKVKKVVVKPGETLSLQRHRHRSEHWVVVKGEALVTVGEDEMVLRPNQSAYVPKGVIHRLANTTDEPLEIIEVQVGDYVGEDDIERFEDRYGR